MANYDSAQAHVFSSEGGYQKKENDSGNYCEGRLVGTNFGISAPTYKQYFGVCPTEAKMKALTKVEANKIYKKLFWDAMNGDKFVNQSVALLVYDRFVNRGHLKDIKDVCEVNFGLKMSEQWNALTVEEVVKVSGVDQEILFNALQADALVRVRKIVKNKPQMSDWLPIWERRIKGIRFVGSDGVGVGGMVIVGAFCLGLYLFH